MSDGWWLQLGIALGVLVLLVGSVALFGLATAGIAPIRVDATVDIDYFTSASLLDQSRLTSRSGEITMGNQLSRTVPISTDQPLADFETFVRALVSHGHDVQIRSSSNGSVQPVAVSATTGVTVSQQRSDESARSQKQHFTTPMPCWGSVEHS